MSISGVNSLANSALQSGGDNASAAQGIRPVTTPAVASTGSVQEAQPAALAQPGPEELKRMAAELQRLVSPVAPELQFSVDESSGRSIIKVTDRTTNEVIKQFPSDETLHIAQELDRFQKGLLLNRKA